MAETSNNPRIQAAIDEATHFHARFQRDPSPANKKLFEDKKAVVSEVTYLENLTAELSKLSEAGRELVVDLVEFVIAEQKVGTITEQVSPDFDLILEDYAHRRPAGRAQRRAIYGGDRSYDDRHRPAEPAKNTRPKPRGFADKTVPNEHKYGETNHPQGFGHREGPEIDWPMHHKPLFAFHSDMSSSQPGRLHAFGIEDTWDAVKSGAKNLYHGLMKYGAKAWNHVKNNAGPALDKASDFVVKRAPSIGGAAAIMGAGMMATGEPAGIATGAGMMAGAALMNHGHVRNAAHGVRRALEKIRTRVQTNRNAKIDNKIDAMFAQGKKEHEAKIDSDIDAMFAQGKKEHEAEVRARPAMAAKRKYNLDAHIGGLDDVPSVTTQHHYDNTLSGHGAALRAARDKVETSDGSVPRPPRTPGRKSFRMINLDDPKITTGHKIRVYEKLHDKIHKHNNGTALDMHNLARLEKHLDDLHGGYYQGKRGVVHSRRSDAMPGYKENDFTDSVSAHIERSRQRK